jgi:hypothetical protein
MNPIQTRKKLPLGSFAVVQVVGTALARDYQEIRFTEDLNLKTIQQSLSEVFERLSSNFIINHEEVKNLSSDFVDYYFHVAVRKAQYPDCLKTLEKVFIESVNEASDNHPLGSQLNPDSYQQIEIL